ncbi:EscR/YscR/HrcR family type III secretion system export apparatus protein [Microvenator marinus]|uniref:EscR/YscR/HrcR family type III secretion system export apparatus protein n=1 Tax=Microvenator marinus TaxID=2600177 RepID=A0A5B8XPM3_9DELT|nr:type III secretion system export apparatus subunit SctR [Microvenator marinus]QED27445.1 EscR/YscR/HrcR family type III secretion system export apparatus protein [Microvenator marinus]
MRDLRWVIVLIAIYSSEVMAATPVVETPSYGWVLFRMVLMLGAVCILAWVSLKWGLKRWVTPDAKAGPMQVLARLPLEPRRTINLIKVGQRVLVVGSSEHGMHALGDLSLDEVELEELDAKSEDAEEAEPKDEDSESSPFKNILDQVKRAGLILLTALPVTLISDTAFAQVPGTSQSPLTLVALLAILALLPFLLVMVTSFVKIAVVLSILRTAIGVQQAPPNQVITGLAMILSLYVMAPVAIEAWEASKPSIDQMEAGEFDASVANYQSLGEEAAAPLKTFLLKHTDDEERVQLYEISLQLRTEEQRKSITPEDLLIVIPAFVMTELKEAFMIGFVLFIPFILVDLVVANILLSLGMHMLSPTTVSLPFKLLLFVLVDGWTLVIRGLLLGYV